jgi:hemoglobin/transferrin/lactoferrin receptor protein
MYGRKLRCPQGSAVEHELRGTSAGHGSHLVKKGLVLWGCAAVSLALTAQAIAQSTTLPQVTVEGKGTTAKKGTAKGAPKAAPQQPAEPVQQVETQAAKEKAQKEAVYNTPAAVSTATKSDLDTFGQVDTGDVLRTMPGTFTRESPQNAGLAINIRGFEGSGRVNTMIDGVRQNFRFTGHEAGGFVFVDPSLLAGVDVARGAVSTAGGAGALAGAANLRTLGVEDIVKPGKSVGTLSSFTYGTNGIGWSEMLAGGMTNGNVGIAAAFSHHEPDNYRNGSGVTVPNTRQDLLSGLFKMDFRLSAEQSLKLGAVVYDNDFLANSALQNVISNTYTAKYAYKPIGNPLVDFKFNVSANNVEQQYFSGSANGRVMTDEGIGFDTSNTSRFNFGGVKIVSTYGYEYFKDDVNVYNKITPSLAGGVNPAGESTIGGAFSQTQFSYGMFDLITAMRYDTYALSGTGSITAFPNHPYTSAVQPLPSFLTAGPYTVDRSEGHFSPKVTVAVKALDWLTPYVTYSESFRAPTVSETMAGGIHPGGSSISFLPNPFLDPEVQKGWEFGANIKQNGLFTRNDTFRLKAGYYNMNVEDYIVACSASYQVAQTPPNPPNTSTRSASYFCNAHGTSKVQGVEVEGMYDAGYAFAGLSYTYTHTNLPSQTDGFGAHSYLPEHTVVVTGGLRFLDQKLTIGSRVSYFSESYVGDVNVGGFYSRPFMPGYTLVDMFSSYKFDTGLELGVTATNLFDVSYTPALSTPVVGATCFGSNLSGCNDSGRGRTVLMTAKSQF